jgi:hypothetical protein
MTLLVHLLFAVALAAAQAAPVNVAEEREQFGRNLVIERGEKASDAVCRLCSISVRGVLEGDAVALGGNVEVSGEVAGDVITLGGGVRLEPGARVGGDAVVIGGPFERAKDSRFGGDVTAIPWFALPGQRRVFVPGALGDMGMSLLAVSLFHAAARPRRIERMADTFRRHYVVAPFIGAALLILAIFLLDVKIHVKHASQIKDDAVLVALLVISGLGWTAASREAGRRLARQSRPFVATLAGAAAITAISLIPFLGVAVAAILIVLTLGIPLTAVLGNAADWRSLARRKAAPPISPAT